jgi:hypothetical protein
MAIASFVCSLGGFILAGIPCLAGVVLGFVARGQIRRSNGSRTGGGLALAGIILGLAEIALIAVLIVGLVLLAQSDNRRLQIAGAPGYATFSGPTGQPLEVGKPWGVACEPIVLQPAAGVPGVIWRQLQQVVTTARSAGVDVSVGTRQDKWYPASLYPPGLTDQEVAFVTISSATGPAPLHGFNQRDHIVFSWNAKPAADGRHEILTSLQAELYLQELTSATVDRLAVRQLIAFSQGVADASAPASGIVDGTSSEGFTDRDYAAMRVMSGCHPPG